jgi:hypothetical protein
VRPHTGFVIPGTKPVARVLTRFAIQNLPLSLKNKQRLYNFFATVTAPTRPVTVKVKNFPRRAISLTLDLRDDLSRNWYYWRYSGYEPGTVRLSKELLKSKSCVFDVGANIGLYTLLAPPQRKDVDKFMLSSRSQRYFAACPTKIA